MYDICHTYFFKGLKSVFNITLFQIQFLQDTLTLYKSHINYIYYLSVYMYIYFRILYGCFDVTFSIIFIENVCHFKNKWAISICFTFCFQMISFYILEVIFFILKSNYQKFKMKR